VSEEFLVRDTRQPGHFWADNELIDVYGPQLGAHGIAVYMALARKAINGTGECRISMRSIAGQIGISVGGVSNAMADLLNLGLARQVDPGDNRSAAVYVLADVKALVNPNYAQLRLEKPPISVHTVNAGVHTMNATVHPVNPAFTQRTRNKERKTFTRLNTKNLLCKEGTRI
jgi:DNA-binding MarR family transcriptional regulator